MEINNNKENSKVSELLEDNNNKDFNENISEMKKEIPFNVFSKKPDNNIISKLFDIKNNSGKQSEIDKELLNFGLEFLYNANKKGD